MIINHVIKHFETVIRGVPAYTQSTQLRTIIFDRPKNKNVLNREKCNKNMPHPGLGLYITSIPILKYS